MDHLKLKRGWSYMEMGKWSLVSAMVVKGFYKNHITGLTFHNKSQKIWLSIRFALIFHWPR